MIRFSLVAALLVAASAAVAAPAPSGAPLSRPAPSAAAEPRQEMRIAAVVNDDVISMADLAARMRFVLASSNIPDSPELRQRLAPQVLRGMVDEKLEMQEAKRLKVAATPKDIEGALARIEQQNNLPKGGLESYLKEHGLSRQSLVTQITASITWTKVVQMRGNLVTPISEEEINEALERIRVDEGQPRVRVAEIFLAVDSPQQDEEVHRFADRLYDQLHQGANFSAVAQQFSQSATAAVGGDLGWMTPSQLNSEIAPIVQHLNPGQAAPPVRVANGYEIVLLIDKQIPGVAHVAPVSAPQPAPVREVPANARVRLVQVMFPLAAKPTEEDRQKVLAQAAKVSQSAKSCGEMAQLGRELAPRTSGDLGQIRVGDLPPELRQAVLTLRIAAPSQPLPLRGGVGVLMVCDRIGFPAAAAQAPAPPPPPTSSAPPPLPTREEIADDLARERYDNLARRYIRDLRRAAAVDYRG
jgi:peptidyl-prolyl cis-trans isomerase SurA